MTTDSEVSPDAPEFAVAIVLEGMDVAEAEAFIGSLRQRHPEIIAQVVRPERMPGPLAIRMIGLQTLRALKTQCLLASKPELDLLLRLAGTRQIDLAIRRIGYAKGRSKVDPDGRRAMLLVAVGPNESIDRLESELGRQFPVLRSEEPPTPADLDTVESAAMLGAEG
jgi:hypothetical protein